MLLRPDPRLTSIATLDCSNGETREENEIAGNKEENSGGTILYLSPGVRVSLGSGLNVYLSYGIPIVTDLNGEQSDIDYRLMSGISFSF